MHLALSVPLSSSILLCFQTHSLSEHICIFIDPRKYNANNQYLLIFDRLIWPLPEVCHCRPQSAQWHQLINSSVKKKKKNSGWGWDFWGRSKHLHTLATQAYRRRSFLLNLDVTCLSVYPSYQWCGYCQMHTVPTAAIQTQEVFADWLLGLP